MVPTINFKRKLDGSRQVVHANASNLSPPIRHPVEAAPREDTAPVPFAESEPGRVRPLTRGAELAAIVGLIATIVLLVIAYLAFKGDEESRERAQLQLEQMQVPPEYCYAAWPNHELVDGADSIGNGKGNLVVIDKRGRFQVPIDSWESGHHVYLYSSAEDGKYIAIAYGKILKQDGEWVLDVAPIEKVKP